MSYFKELIPSMYHYFTTFKELDETDLKIIFAMAQECPEGPRNVRKISEKLGLPQQTVNYRVLRFGHQDLVRFRAIVNEALLGLTNYAVVATAKPGLLRENKKGDAVNAGTFLTCYPVWRLLEEVHGGDSHGFFVQYSIPREKENDLKLFLKELKKIGCIMKVDDFCRVTPSRFNRPSLDLYRAIRKAVEQGRSVSFDWEKWGDEFDKAEEAILPEETTPISRISFSYEHLLVLFHLERNLREKFVDIAKSMGEPSAKVTEWFREVLRRHLIESCRVEIYPIDPVTSMHLVLKLNFNNEVALNKFISHLNGIPYPVTYQKVAQKNIVFAHMMIPPTEYFDFHNVVETISRRQDIISNFSLYLSNYYAKFDNIMLFKTFSKKDNKWLFSFEVIRKELKRLLDDTKFKF